MSSLRQLLRAYRLLPEQIIRLAPELFDSLEALATAQQRSVHDVVIEALHATVHVNHAQTRNDLRWQTLTPREQQVAALTCLGYTNHEIAAVLFISVNTVRSHMRGVLEKYQVANKSELRLILSNWNFDAWAESPDASGELFTSED